MFGFAIGLYAVFSRISGDVSAAVSALGSAPGITFGAVSSPAFYSAF